MEVHHHSKHGKKKFTEYLLEGLMIFVAVTLGFFAESLREHYINAEKVHASMQSMIRNLEYDSIRCSVNLEANLSTCAGLDSLRYELDIAIQQKGSPDRIYYLTRKYAGANRAVFNEQAITELKNSGTLRLVKNDSLMNEITDYYERRVGAANRYSDAMTDAGKRFAQSANNVLSWKYYDEWLRRDTVFGSDHRRLEERFFNGDAAAGTKTLLTIDRHALEQFYNETAAQEFAIHTYNSFLRYALVYNSLLQKHIRNEYGKEN